jgi:predicted metal-dependent hydrolase
LILIDVFSFVTVSILDSPILIQFFGFVSFVSNQIFLCVVLYIQTCAGDEKFLLACHVDTWTCRLYCNFMAFADSKRQLELLFDSSCTTEFGTRLTFKDRDEAHRKRIAGYLTMLLPDPVDVVFTNNRSTMLTFKKKGGRLSLRLHRLFRHAEDPDLENLAKYLASNDPNSSKAIDTFVKCHRQEITEQRQATRKPKPPEGRYHNLSRAFSKVNATYFEGRVEVTIGWGRAPAKRKKRAGRSKSRALATYSFDDRTIRVSPILDAADVPDYVIEWIIYHEVLHHVLPVEQDGERRLYHTNRFRAMERAFIRYSEAKKWESKNLERLLS